ncbi:hypothetical protein K4L44_15200 [Halosquirtibacter laminarini]|uniref:Uncharacterized protein n=1 Tax=Halosquirtibacter laminarini TaxID=3374600 RepID=A0AC61NHZ6_9BACT|nr:hypothetical protein K4L44_15200 [Prolixibacteraceae bacterium]
MKIYIYSLLIGAALLTACNPMEDINDQVDKEVEAIKELQLKQSTQTKFAEDVKEMTLSDADYKFLEGDDFTENEKNIGKHKSFSATDNDETVNKVILKVLDKRYNAKNGQLIKITYDVYNPFNVGEFKDSYACTNEDYKSVGEKYSNFSNTTSISTFLKNKYDMLTFKRGDYVNLSYKYYDKGHFFTYTDKPVLYDGDKFITASHVEKDEYTQMGFKYPNFSNESDAKSYLIKLYNRENTFAEEGEELNKITTVRKKIDGNYKSFSYLVRLIFKEGTYVALEDIEARFKHFVYIAEKGVKYKFKWISVPAFKFEEITDDAVQPDYEYTFTDADYEFVGNGKYKNFDMEPTHPWAKEQDPDVFLDMIGSVLRIQYATKDPGFVVQVTYERYTKKTSSVPTKIKLRVTL